MIRKHQPEPEAVIGARVFALCMKKPCTIDELNKVIYDSVNNYNYGKLFRIVSALCKHGDLNIMLDNKRNICFKGNNMEKL